MCTNFVLYGISACIFNSWRICAPLWLVLDLCLHIQFLKDMCTRSIFWLSRLFSDERSTRDAVGLTKGYDFVEKCFGDDPDLPWSLDDVWPTEKGLLTKDFLMACCSLGNFLPPGNDYLLLSHKSLRIDVNSTLEGVLPNSTWEILFCNSRGSYFCALDSRRESIYNTGFTGI